MQYPNTSTFYIRTEFKVSSALHVVFMEARMDEQVVHNAGGGCAAQRRFQEDCFVCNSLSIDKSIEHWFTMVCLPNAGFN